MDEGWCDDEGNRSESGRLPQSGEHRSPRGETLTGGVMRHFGVPGSPAGDTSKLTPSTTRRRRTAALIFLSLGVAIGYTEDMKKIRAIFACSLVSVIFGGCSLLADDEGAVEERERQDYLEVEISTIGLDHLSQSPVVLLRTLEGGRAIPIWIGLSEAQAIARALHGVEMPRPLTHDLTINLLAEGDLTIEEVIVHDMRDGIFYGRILLRHGESGLVKEVDSRPSDALALALRAKAIIRVSEAVLEDTPDFHFVPPDVGEQVVQVLGMTVVTASPLMRERFELEEHAGVIVSAVSGVAERKGVRPGDVITRIREKDIETPMDVLDSVLESSPGSEVEIRLFREGSEETINLPVEADEDPESEEPGVTI